MRKTVDMRRVYRQFHEYLVSFCEAQGMEELVECFRQYPKLFDNAYDAGVIRNMHRTDSYSDGRFSGCCESIAIVAGISKSKVKYILDQVIDEVDEGGDEPEGQ